MKSRVVKIDSEETWDFFTSQAKKQGCPVIVHFTASWCMPSVAMKPFFRRLASSHHGILFLRVDVDEVKELASKMEIKAMPTFLFMKEGDLVDKLVGANPEEIKKRNPKFEFYHGLPLFVDFNPRKPPPPQAIAFHIRPSSTSPDAVLTSPTPAVASVHNRGTHIELRAMESLFVSTGMGGRNFGVCHGLTLFVAYEMRQCFVVYPLFSASVCSVMALLN
ncbi:unnamed protein product [Fraxinus pennsylvanica]|uniref:Thioredoxin domain-containing protein n=1 Tax=Fraxinus pennsylvanica TaxID=56036 RepID=A0AAD2DLW9_9LAMI|nr:unnamed protein product [Fraxinus pennsylvanica]